MTIDWSEFRGKTVFITGSHKNSGKTTFLKYALANLRAINLPPAFMSIGVDGEQCDYLYGNLKPIIIAARGDYIVTTEKAMNASDAAFSIIEVFPQKNIFGRHVLSRVIREGSVELIGPSCNSRIAEIATRVFSGTTASTFLVDGAVNRVTQISSVTNAAFVNVLRVTPSTVKSTTDLIKLTMLMTEFDEYDGSFAGNPYFIDGALTSAKIERLPDDCTAVVVDDLSKVFITYAEMLRLAARVKILFRNKLALLFFVVNLFNIGEKYFFDFIDCDTAARIVINPFAE